MTQPTQTYPVTIETAWHGLMTQLATKNVAHANEVKFCAKGLLALTKRK